MKKLPTGKKNPLQLLNFLIKDSASKEDILKKFNIKSSTFYKYLRFIKETGFNVTRYNSEYKVMLFQKAAEFSKTEMDIIAHLMLLASVMLPDYKSNNFNRAVEKIASISNEKNKHYLEEKYRHYKIQNEKEYYRTKIAVLEPALKEKNAMQITLTCGKKINLVPIEINYDNDKTFAKFRDEEEKIKFIALERIANITSVKEDENIPFESETIFELYGKLAKSYMLKDKERIIDSGENTLVVANSSKDKTSLFKRLLRYDILCKVKFPKSDAKEFKTLVEKSLLNIEGREYV